MKEFRFCDRGVIILNTRSKGINYALYWPVNIASVLRHTLEIEIYGL